MNLQVNFNIKYNGLCKVYIYRKYYESNVTCGSILAYRYGIEFCNNKKLTECCYDEFCYKNDAGVSLLKRYAVRNVIKKSIEETNSTFFSEIQAGIDAGPLNDGRYVDLFNNYITCDCWSCDNEISKTTKFEDFYSFIDYSESDLINEAKEKWNTNTIRSRYYGSFNSNMFSYKIVSYEYNDINPCHYVTSIETVKVIFDYIFVRNGEKYIRVENLKTMKEYKPF